MRDLSNAHRSAHVISYRSALFEMEEVLRTLSFQLSVHSRQTRQPSRASAHTTARLGPAMNRGNHCQLASPPRTARPAGSAASPAIPFLCGLLRRHRTQLCLRAGQPPHRRAAACCCACGRQARPRCCSGRPTRQRPQRSAGAGRRCTRACTRWSRRSCASRATGGGSLCLRWVASDAPDAAMLARPSRRAHDPSAAPFEASGHASVDALVSAFSDEHFMVAERGRGRPS